MGLRRAWKIERGIMLYAVYDFAFYVLTNYSMRKTFTLYCVKQIMTLFKMILTTAYKIFEYSYKIYIAQQQQKKNSQSVLYLIHMESQVISNL